jgi:hypothetical protein
VVVPFGFQLAGLHGSTRPCRCRVASTGGLRAGPLLTLAGAARCSGCGCRTVDARAAGGGVRADRRGVELSALPVG